MTSYRGAGHAILNAISFPFFCLKTVKFSFKKDRRRVGSVKTSGILQELRPGAQSTNVKSSQVVLNVFKCIAGM